MELRNYLYKNESIGTFFENESAYVFFGNKNFSEEHFFLFEGVEFQFLKQTHGDQIFFATNIVEPPPEADSHITSTKKLALVIQTADCLPILMFDEANKWAAAVHAGWRGVDNKIALKTLRIIEEKFGFVNAQVFVGPHIQQESFLVDKDVAKIFETLYPVTDHEIIYNPYNKKYLVSLIKILKQQIGFFKLKNFYCSDVDTFLNEKYSSFRRQKTSCRNWSFIYLK